MTQKLSEYVELVIVSILSALVYLYVVHPILEDINPVLTFNSNGSGLGILSMAITITILSVAYSVSKPIIRFLIYIPIMFISLVYSLGPKIFIAQIGVLFFE